MTTDQTSLSPATDPAQDRPAKGRAGGRLRGALIAIALLPVLAALILNAQADFDPFGTWINPVVLILTAATVAVIWAVTGKNQR